MSPFAAAVVKALGAAGVAALLTIGVVNADSPSPTPSPSASPSPTSSPSAAGTPQNTQQQSNDRRADRRAIRRAVIEAEADVLGLQPDVLVKDLRSGQKVSDLAKDRGMTKDQFADRLAANLKPRLEALVDQKAITQAQADRILDRIAKGFVPFWDGLHHRNK